MSPPCATLDVSAGAVTLGAPGLGTVRVTAAEITWQAADGVAEAELVAGLGEWAWSQQQRLRGVIVCRGTVVVTERGAVLLAGPSREGASLTAAPLVLGGAAVLADGACPLVVADDAVTALPGRPSLELDAAVAASWPRPDDVTPLACGRPRMLVRAPVAAEPTALAAVVLLSRRGSGSGGAPLDPVRAATLLTDCLVPSLAEADRRRRAAAEAAAIVAAVPVAEVDLDDAPPVIGRRVLDTLAALGVGA